MGLQHSYALLAPLYDAAIARVTAPLRRASLEHLPHPRKVVLLPGIGTGLDVPLLPKGNRYVGVDLTRAMLQRVPRDHPNLALVRGNVLRLPFADASFDAAVLHFILAIVPDAQRLLAETARVLRPGGLVLVLDKFLRPGELSLVRRTLSPITARIATRLDVVFEEVLPAAPSLNVVADQPLLAGGWVRAIRLKKRS